MELVSSVRTAKKTQLFAITKINFLVLFNEIIAVYTENHTRLIQSAQLLIIKSCDTYSYHWALKG
jgi:hypothetical protein